MATTLRPVAPEEIQSELNRIWESLETTNTTRASLFNLIFFTQKNHRSNYIQKIAQKVIEKFPSRILFVIADKEATTSLVTTKVGILTSSSGEFDIACDYIQIEVAKEACALVPFLMLPHILPDLPVYLVWGEDPSQEDPEVLRALANRLIFDSENANHLPRFAKSVLNQHLNAKCDIADLNWARLEDWRDLLSMAFYPEERLEQIQRAEQLHIAYNAQETPFFCHTKIQAIYLQGWLACQLGWTFESLHKTPEGMLFVYRGLKNPIKILLQPEIQPNLPPGLILSLEISTAAQEHFIFLRNRTLLQEITLQHSTTTYCALPCHYVLSKAESGHSLVKEICHRGTSSHYLKVLELLAQMEEVGLC